MLHPQLVKAPSEDINTLLAGVIRACDVGSNRAHSLAMGTTDLHARVPISYFPIAERIAVDLTNLVHLALKMLCAWTRWSVPFLYNVSFISANRSLSVLRGAW